MIHKGEKQAEIETLVAKVLFPTKEEAMDDKLKAIWDKLHEHERNLKAIEEAIRQIQSYRAACDSIKSVE